MTEYFRIEKPNGEVTFEERAGRLPSDVTRQARAEFGPTTRVIFGLGVDAQGEKARREALKEQPIKQHDLVVVSAYGRNYVGRVETIGRKHAKVWITLQSGQEKLIKRPLTDMYVTKI